VITRFINETISGYSRSRVYTQTLEALSTYNNRPILYI
jgi:hypothetical protein